MIEKLQYIIKKLYRYNMIDSHRTFLLNFCSIVHIIIYIVINVFNIIIILYRNVTFYCKL